MTDKAGLIPKETTEVTVTSRQEAILENASWMAKKLKKIIDDGELAVDCGGKKKHVTLEAWTTVARLQNEAPHSKVTRTYKDDAGNEVVEAHAWVTDVDEKIVSEADAIVSEKEKNWKGRHLSARISMAQTRAMSKALRLRHSWIMVMAGYSATPAEEMEPLIVVEAAATVKESVQEQAKQPEPKPEPVEAKKEPEPTKEPEQKPIESSDIPRGKLTWTGKISRVDNLESNGYPVWELHGEDGIVFRTGEPKVVKEGVAKDSKYLVTYEVNGRKTKVALKLKELKA